MTIRFIFYVQMKQFFKKEIKDLYTNIYISCRVEKHSLQKIRKNTLQKLCFADK